TGVVHSNGTGVLSSSAVNLAGGSNEVTGILPVGNGGTGIDGSLAANGTLLIGNGTGYTLSTLTAGTGIAINNGAGSITITSNQGNIDAFFSQTQGLLYANNSTVDFSIGGQSTASAKFAVLNVNSGVPTASVSAGLTGGISINASGTISTTDMQTLTLGGASTGNVRLSGFGTGIIHSNSTGVLSYSAVNLAGGALEVTGVLPTGNGGTGFSTYNQGDI